jgi:hypothetical protein
MEPDLEKENRVLKTCLNAALALILHLLDRLKKIEENKEYNGHC